MGKLIIERWLSNLRNLLRQPGNGGLVGCLMSLLGMALLGSLPGCGSSEARNVLLITLDTTRADRFGRTGYERAGTPVLDGLADRGVLFGHAYTTTPVTLPSHVSILTGTYPPFHGVRDNRRYRASRQLETLAEVFQSAGFRTGAFVAAYPLDEQYGLSQGFEVYDDDTDSDGGFNPTDFHFPERRAQAVVDEAAQWVGGLSTRERRRLSRAGGLFAHRSLSHVLRKQIAPPTGHEDQVARPVELRSGLCTPCTCKRCRADGEADWTRALQELQHADLKI